MTINEKTISMLQTAYCMELETIMNYLANEEEHLVLFRGFLKEYTSETA